MLSLRTQKYPKVGMDPKNDKNSKLSTYPTITVDLAQKKYPKFGEAQTSVYYVNSRSGNNKNIATTSLLVGGF
jgi:hypothetical protein